MIIPRHFVLIALSLFPPLVVAKKGNVRKGSDGINSITEVTRRLSQQCYHPQCGGDLPASSPGGGKWFDSDGDLYDCAWYAEEASRCDEYGDGYQNFGLTANMACCACGGGAPHIFDAGWGPCSTYSTGMVNHAYCNQDTDSFGVVAQDICRECGVCGESVSVTLDKITCVRENDGGGIAEEIFGNLYVNVAGETRYLWTVNEDAAVSINEGSAYHVGVVQTFQNLALTDTVTIGGHLYEEDTGGDDNLGSNALAIPLEEITTIGTTTSRVLRYTHDDTIIDVQFSFTAATQKFLVVDSVTCIVPSKGVDGATAALVGIAIGLTSVTIGVGVSVAGAPQAGVAIINIGVDTAFASDAFVDLYGTNHPGDDDLFVMIDETKIWPTDEYMGISSQQTHSIATKVLLNRDRIVSLMEYDSGSADDDLGGLQVLATDPVGTYKQLVTNEDEGSTYEINYRIVEE